MTVHFIGAGPGAADLITLRARDLIASSPVCLYAGSLVAAEVLDHCPPGATLVDTARMTLDEIVDAILAADRSGHDIARLCSGDPSIFSAVAEQMRRLDAAGVDYDVCPGVTAFSSAAAELNQELTVPGVAQSVVLTRTSENASAMPAAETLATLGAARATMVVHLSVQRIEAVVAELAPVYGDHTPVAVVAWSSRPDRIILRGTLADIVGKVRTAGVKRAAVIMVGDAMAAHGFRDSHLYSDERDRSCTY